jgi:predicted TPR repeat methyltransferase
LRPLVRESLVGVDISKKMLDVAAKCTLNKGCGLKDLDNKAAEKDKDKPLYDHLASLDLETATLKELNAEDNGFEIIVAADVLVYFGDIQKLIQNFAKLSDKGAFLIFSCERIDEDDESTWRLQKSGRYAHSKRYVIGAAANAGYKLVGYEEITPRFEKGEAVLGHLFRFSLSRAEEAKDEL